MTASHVVFLYKWQPHGPVRIIITGDGVSV